MLFCGRLGAGGARKGRVSRRYIKMNPRIKEMPIQAWGSRLRTEASWSLVGSGEG